MRRHDRRNGSGLGSSRRRRSPGARPGLEALEARRLLATVSLFAGSVTFSAGSLVVSDNPSTTVAIDATDPANVTVRITGPGLRELDWTSGGTTVSSITVNESSGSNIVQATGNVSTAVNNGGGADEYDVTLNGTGSETYTITGGGSDQLKVTGIASDNALGLSVGALTLQSEAVNFTGVTHLGVTTAGTQTYASTVDIGVDTTLTAGSTVTFQSALHDLAAPTYRNLDIQGNAVFDGAVYNLSALTVTGTTRINTASITTTGDQTYGGAVDFTVNTTLTGGTVTFGSTLTDGALVTFKNLLVQGNAVFGGAVSNLQDLEVTGSTTFGAGGTSVTSHGMQTYDGAVLLGTDVSLSGASVTFGSTVDDASSGAGGLTISTTGATTFTGLVGGNLALNFLTKTGAGPTDLGANVTAGAVSIQYAVVLTSDVTLTSNVDIQVGGTVDGDGNGPWSLTAVTTGTGTMEFSGAFGGTHPLQDLTLTNAGPLTLAAPTISLAGHFTQNGTGSVSTAASVTTGDASGASFASAVTLTGPVTIDTSAGNGPISLATVDGFNGLTLAAGTGNVSTGSLGASTALAGLTINSAANVTIGGTLATTGDVAQAAGSGTTTFNGTGTGSVAGALNVTTVNIAFQGGTFTAAAATLNATGTVTQTAAGALSLGGLRLLGSGTFSLNTSAANAVGNLVANLTGTGSLNFADSTALALGVFGDYVGVTTSGGAVTLALANANLDVQTGIVTSGGPITLGTGTGTFSATDHGEGARTINAGTGAVSITADTLGGIGLPVVANGGITLQPSTSSRAINLNDATTGCALSNTDLANLSTTGTLTIGASGGTGAIGIGSAGAVGVGSSLTLNGGSVTFDGNGLTLPDNATLTFNTAGITGSGVGTDVTIGGASGTVALNTSGAVRNLFTPLALSVARLGASTVNGLINLTDAVSLAVVGAVSSANNSITISVGTNQFSTSASGTINAGSNFVKITADTLGGIGATITGNGGIIFKPVTGNQSISLNDAAGGLSLSNADLAHLSTTTVLKFGMIGGTGAINIGSLGAVSVGSSLILRGGAVAFDTNGLTLASSSTLTFQTGAIAGPATGTAVTIGGAGAVYFSTTGAVGGTTTPLALSVAQLGASTVSGLINLTDAVGLTVTGAVSSAGNPITLSAGANSFGNLSGATIDGGLAPVKVIADTLTGIGATINAGSIVLKPFTLAQPINLNDATTGCALSNADLANLSASVVTIGALGGTGTIGIGSQGAVSVGANLTLRGGAVTFHANGLTLPSFNTLTFNTGAITGLVSGTDVTIPGGSVAISQASAGAVGLHTAVAALSVPSGNGAVTVTNAGDLALGASSVTGSLNVAAPGAITVTGAVAVTSGALTIASTGTNTSLTVNGGLSTSGGNLTLTATGDLTIGSGVAVVSGAGTLGLGADLTALGAGDDGIGTLTIGAGAVVDGAGINLRGADVNIDGTASVGAVDTNQVTIRSSLGSRPMSLGGTASAVSGINLTDAELARIVTTATGTITIGDSGQTGNITFTTATPATTAGASTVVAQSSAGGGQIILDNGAGSGPALDGRGGNVTLTAGTGGIVEAAANAAGTADIANAPATSLTTSAPLGTSFNPLQLGATSLTTDTSAAVGNQFLSALTTVTTTSLTAGAGTINLQGGTFALAASGAISSGSSVIVKGATLALGGYNQTLAAVTLKSGGITGTTGVLTSATDFDVLSGALSAKLVGSVGLTKTTVGTVTLSGANSYTGATTVTGGTLEVDGALAASSAVTVAAGATLAGTGTIGGTVAVNGTLAPGTAGAVGILTTGAVSFSAGSTFSARINGPGAVAGTDYDQLVANGVSIAGASLSLSNPGAVFAPGPGNVVKLIRNTSGSATMTAFAGQAEGSQVSLNGQSPYLTYQGGAGNDVTLTTVGPDNYTEAGDSAGAHAFVFQLAGPNLRLLEDGATIDARPLVSVAGASTFTGQAGVTDTLTLNFVPGYFVFPGGLTVDGGVAGAGVGKTLSLAGGTLATLAYRATGAGAGTLTINGDAADAIHFTRLTPVVVTSGVGTLDVTIADALTHAATVTGSAGSNRVAFDGGLESLTFPDPSTQLNLHGNGQNDTVAVNSIDAGFHAGLAIDGLGSAGVATLGASLNLTGALAVTAGTIDLNAASVTTTGTQTYSGPVTLGATSSLTGGVTFTSTIDDATAGAHGLSVTGTVSFGGSIGSGQALGSLAVTGATTLAGSAVTTTGAQTYNGAVAISGTGTAFTGSAVTFVGALTGPAVTVTTTGAATFDAPVNVASLTTGGGTVLNGGTVNTAGGQTYGDALVLGADTTLTDVGPGSPGITFNGTIDSAPGQTYALTVVSNNPKTFNKAVGASSPLGALTTAPDPADLAQPVAQPTVINAPSITTMAVPNSPTETGKQTYDSVVLGTAKTSFVLNGGTLNYGSLTPAPGTNPVVTVDVNGSTSALDLSGVFTDTVVNLHTAVGAGAATQNIQVTASPISTQFVFQSPPTTTTGAGANGAFKVGGAGGSGGSSFAAVNLTLISSGGSNTLDFSGTVPVELDLGSSGSQNLYVNALTPNLEQQYGISGSVAAALAQSTLTLQGSFPSVIGGSNDTFSAGSASAFANTATGLVVAQSGSQIVLTGTGNTVYAQPGTSVLAFSGGNQVIQSTGTSLAGLVSQLPTAAEVSGFLGKKTNGGSGFLGKKNNGGSGYLEAIAPASATYLADNPNLAGGFVASVGSQYVTWISTDPAATQGFLGHPGNGGSGFFGHSGNGGSGFLGHTGNGGSGFLGHTGNGGSGYLLVKSKNGGSGFLAFDSSGLVDYLASTPSALADFETANAVGASDLTAAGGLAAYVQNNPTALTNFFNAYPNDVENYLESDPTALSPYLAADPTALQSYVTQKAGPLGQFIAGSGAATQAFLGHPGNGGSGFLGHGGNGGSGFLGHPGTGGSGFLLVKGHNGGSGYLLNDNAGLVAFIAGNPTALADFELANPGSSTSIQADGTGLAAYVQNNPSSLTTYFNTYGGDVEAYLEATPATTLSAYLHAHPDAEQAYVQGETNAFATFIAGSPKILAAFEASYGVPATPYDGPGLQSLFQTNAGVLGDFVQHNPNVLDQFLASSSTNLGLDLTNDPDLLKQYLTDNPGALTGFLTSNPSYLDTYLSSSPSQIGLYLATDPSVVGQYLLNDLASPTHPAGTTSLLQQFVAADPAALQPFLAANPGAFDAYLGSNPDVLLSFFTGASLDAFRLKVNLSGSGNFVSGGILSTNTLGDNSSFVESLTADQASLINAAVQDNIPLSAIGLNVSIAADGNAGSNTVVGGLLGNFTVGGSDTRFVVEDPTLLGLPAGSLTTQTLTQALGSGGSFSGAGGKDSFYFVGGSSSPFGTVALGESAATGASTLDFSNDQGGPVHLDLTQTGPQTVTPNNLTLTVANAATVTKLIGSPASDYLVGNNNNDLIQGAALPGVHPAELPAPAGPPATFQTQWVYLDFSDFVIPKYLNSSSVFVPTPESLHNGTGVYTTADQMAILQGVQAIYASFSNIVQFTLTRPTSGPFETVYFNDTSTDSSGNPQSGGHSSELDFRNLNLNTTVQVDINGFLGGSANQVPDTTVDFRNLSITVAAHEVGHTLGLEHEYAFGPIGFGIFNPPGLGSYNPSYPGPVGAFTTGFDLIASPASVGSTLQQAASGLVQIGERDAVVLAFINGGTVFGGTTDATHATPATAQPVSLAKLNVPNPVATGFDSGKALDVAALDVTGTLVTGPTTGSFETYKDGTFILDGNGQKVPIAPSVSDYYSFQGQAGDVMNFQLLSSAMTRNGQPFDGVLRIYGPDGQLVPYYSGKAVSDDSFEFSDPALVDLTLPVTGTYTIQVSAFNAQTDPDLKNDPSYYSPLIDPTTPGFNSSYPALYYGTETGHYELFLYRFAAYNADAQGNPVSGNDTLVGGSGGATLTGGSGNDTIITGSGISLVDGGGGVNQLQATGAGSFTLSSTQLIAPGGASAAFSNINFVTLNDTSATGGNTFTIQPSWTGMVTLTGGGGNDTLIAPGSLNGPTSVLGSLAGATVGQDLNAPLSLTGSLGSLQVAGTAPAPITVGGNLTGPLSVGGTLATLRVGGAASGTIAAAQVGTIGVAAGTGPVALQVTEANTTRRVEIATTGNPYPSGPSNPLPGVTFQEFYEGTGGAPVLVNPQLTARINNQTGNTGPDQFDLSLVTYNDTAKFNLARLDALGVAGVGNVAVEGDLLSTVSAAAAAYFGASSLSGGIALPLDKLAGASVRDFVPNGVILAASIQALAFGSLALPNGRARTGAASESDDAQNLLAAGTAVVAAHDTFRVTFADLPAQQVGFFFGTDPSDRHFDDRNVAFAVQSVSVMNAAGTANVVTTSNSPRGAVTALVTVMPTYDSHGHALNSVVQSIALRGDGGSITTQQPIAGAITSTGPLGDLTLAGPLVANITAPSIFGSININGGALAGIVQTTGLRTDPITGTTAPAPGDIGRVYLAPNPKDPAVLVPTVTVIHSSGAGLTGQIISAGNLISQVVADGGIKGLIEAGGNIGTTTVSLGVTNPNGPAYLGGITSNGPLGGTIVALGNLNGVIVINGPVQASATNPLAGVIAVNGNVLGSLTFNGPFSGQFVAEGTVRSNITFNGPLQGTAVLPTRIASKGGFLGNVTVNGGLNAYSALVSDGAIGDTGLRTTLVVNGNNAGFIAAKTTVNLGRGRLSGSLFMGSTGTLNANAVDAVFAANAQGGTSLPPGDQFDYSTGFDLVNLKTQILKKLGALNNKGKTLNNG